VLALAVLARLIQLLTGRFPEARPAPTTYGSYRELGLALYTDYVLLVEMVGLLLLAAIVGALILAKQKID
jgi:NADH-quinone oxidoreductase subunit J